MLSGRRQWLVSRSWTWTLVRILIRLFPMLAQEGSSFFRGNRPGTGGVERKQPAQLGAKRLHQFHAMATPASSAFRLDRMLALGALCWAEKLGGERPSLSGDWVQSEVLTAIKSNASQPAACSLRPLYGPGSQREREIDLLKLPRKQAVRSLTGFI